MYIKRLLGDHARKALERGKSILMLGARQTGKTTFIREELAPDVEISFVRQADRLRYERDPQLIENEIQAITEKSSKQPLIFIDEIQKIPKVMDSVQYFIDKKLAQFILSGSSARKLKHGTEINLLPGRVVALNLSPLTYLEIPASRLNLNDLLLFGSLPAIVMDDNNENRETDLASYVTTYLEDEIRTEAVVRNLGHFAHFLQLAAGESGKGFNMQRLSQDIGIAATTISSYLQILIDCLIAYRIEPITQTTTKRKLIHASRYMFFDLGIRRVCANEGTRLPAKILGDLFEQYVGLQLIAFKEVYNSLIKVRYWRDSAGPEIDYVLEVAGHYVPIEVKWSDKPNTQDAKHLVRFLSEYDNAKIGFIVCRTPRAYILPNANIRVISWQQIHDIFEIIAKIAI